MISKTHPQAFYRVLLSLGGIRPRVLGVPGDASRRISMGSRLGVLLCICRAYAYWELPLALGGACLYPEPRSKELSNIKINFSYPKAPLLSLSSKSLFRRQFEGTHSPMIYNA